MPAGEAGGQAGVLALLADGQGELVVGDDHGCVVGLLVDEHAADLGRRKRVGHVDGGVLVPLDDVDALAAELGDHGADTGALGADACAHRVEVGLTGVDGDLGAGACLAGDGLDLDDAVVDFRDLDLEQATDEVGVGAAHDDGGTGALVAAVGADGVGLADVDDEGLDALVVLVVLALGLLVALDAVAPAAVEVRQLGLDAVGDLDDGEVRGGLQDGARDHLELAVDVLLVDVGAGSVANNLIDHALCALRRDAGDVIRGDVMLLVVGVVAGLRVLLANAHQLVDIDLAGVAVDGDAGIPVQLEDVLVALGQLLLKAVQDIVFVDVALLGKLCQGINQIRRHVLSSR